MKTVDERKREYLLKEWDDLNRGSDVAYDMAMNDGGASVRKLMRKMKAVEAELKKLEV